MAFSNYFPSSKIIQNWLLSLFQLFWLSCSPSHINRFTFWMGQLIFMNQVIVSRIKFILKQPVFMWSVPPNDAFVWLIYCPLLLPFLQYLVLKLVAWKITNFPFPSLQSLWLLKRYCQDYCGQKKDLKQGLQCSEIPPCLQSWRHSWVVDHMLCIQMVLGSIPNISSYKDWVVVASIPSKLS